MRDETLVLTPDLLLAAYAEGIFPMAESRDNPDIFWVDPKRRGVIPLDGFHISRSLARRMRKAPWVIRYDSDFRGVVTGCADRDETWINEAIFDLYMALHWMGYAHSVEVWEGDALLGGSYGVAIGGAFFAESMFSRRTDASKVALAYLTDHLWRQGFTLFDTQFLTPHLATLGGIEISRSAYRAQLYDALRQPAEFSAGAPVPSASEVIQRSIHTS